MDVSVVIPTRDRPEKVGACLARLRLQRAPGVAFEVLVGFDGPDQHGDTLARRAWEGVGRVRSGLACGPDPALSLMLCERRGQAHVRNQLISQARGQILLFLNDDMLPTPGLVAAHATAQRDRARRRSPAIVLGAAPWVVREPDTLFARLLRETSMVFFYDRMTDPDPERDWGFRHAWTLNCSAPARLVRDVGGFTVFPSTYGYEDDELAWRLTRRCGAMVLFRPDALAWHDHAMSPDDYLAREHRLGYAAWGFARAAPDCARELFRRDITSADELAYCESSLAREGAGARALLGTFRSYARIAARAIDGPSTPVLLSACYQQHLPLKRLLWRAGLLAAARGLPCSPDPDAVCAPPRRDAPSRSGATTSPAGASMN